MSRWNSYFFFRVPARSGLAFQRCVFTAYLAAAALSPLRRPPGIEPLFRLEPLLLRVWHLPPPGAGWTPIFYAWCFALLMAAIGAGGRLAAVIACLLALYLCGESLSFGLAFHEESILALGLLVMAFAAAPARAPLLRLLLVYVFFSAGVYKLWLNGDYWLSGRAVGDGVAQSWANPGMAPLRAWLAAQPAVCTALSYATLLIEALFPLALFSRRARVVLLPAGFGLVAGIWGVFGYHFVLYMAPLFVAWIPWEKISGGPAAEPAG